MSGRCIPSTVCGRCGRGEGSDLHPVLDWTGVWWYCGSGESGAVPPHYDGRGMMDEDSFEELRTI